MLSKTHRRKLAHRISAQKVVYTSLLVDVLDILLNLGVALVTGSVVMIAEALQGIAGLASTTFLLIGLARSERPPDTDSPFGYGREIYFWTLLSGLVMVTFLAGLTMYFGWQRLVSPQALYNLSFAFVVLGIGIISNGYSLSLSFRRLIDGHPGRQIIQHFMQSPLVETKTTFILDLMGTSAAILGFVSLLFFGATGDSQFDGIGAILIGVIVAILAVFLLLGVLDLLIGKAAHPDVEQRIREAALRHPKVTEVLKMRTMHIGTERLLVNLDVHFAHNLTTQEIEQVVDELKSHIKEEVPHAKVVQVELETPRKELEKMRAE